MMISEFAVRRRQFTTVVFLALVGVGLSSVAGIPRAEDPTFPSPNFNIIAVFPGASPTDIESLVVDPLEGAIGELDQLRRMRTRIEDGVAVIAVEFDTESDPDAKHEEVLRQVNSKRATMPDGLASLEVNRFATNNVAIAEVALVSETAPYRELERQALRLRDRLRTLAGVKEVETWAHPDQQVRVDVDLERLAAVKIPLSQVLSSIQSDNANIPGGSVEIGTKKLNVKTSGPYTSVPEVGATVIGGAQGSVVRLRDVATVAQGYEDQTYLGRYNGSRAVFVTVTAKDRQNIFLVRDRINAELAELAKGLPSNIVLERGFDQAENVAERLGGLSRDFVIAILLVLITLLPLGIRASLVVMVSIPLSLAMGVAMLHLTGYSINQLSIVGFVIALGLLVDDSIVVTENIARHLREGRSKIDAAIEGTRQIGVAVLGCTATLIFAFLPLLFLPGGPGQFIRSMPMAVVFTILASLFVSLTIIPLLASVLLKPHQEGDGVFYRLMTRGIERTYRPLLDVALKRPKSTVVVALALFGGSVALVPAIGFSLFPKAGTPQFLVRIETPDGTKLTETDAATRFAEGVLRGHPEVGYLMSNVGHGNPQVYYNVFPAAGKSNHAEIFAETTRMRPERAAQFFDGLRRELAEWPNARIEVKEFENGPPIDAPIMIRIVGEDLDQLRALAGEVEEILKQHPGTRDVQNPIAARRTDVAVRADAEKAGLLGVPMVEIDRSIRLAIAGLVAGQYRTPEGEEHDIVVRAASGGHPSLVGSVPGGANPPAGAFASLNALDRLSVSSVTGAAIPLRALAKAELKSSAPIIQHHNRERAVNVTAFVETGFNTDRVTQEIIALLGKKRWPQGYRWAAAGEIESRQESFGGLGTAILIAVFGVLAVLVLEFRTFKSTLIVASVIPLGVVGGLVALYLAGMTLSFTATIGFVALIGIEVKNSILLVDFTNQLREQGVSVEEAIRRAGEVRFFPILLTTLTAIGGLLPLALSGSGLYSPLAWVIIGGLISSTILSRLVTPVMYLLLAPDVEAIPATPAPLPGLPATA